MAKQLQDRTTDEQIARALQLAKSAPPMPLASAIKYVDGQGFDAFVIRLEDGGLHLVPRAKLQGFEGATKKQLQNVEVIMGGSGLEWPDLNLSIYIPSLMDGVLGDREWMKKIGRAGGQVRSRAKTRAARKNGVKGGRPAQTRKKVAA